MRRLIRLSVAAAVGLNAVATLAGRGSFPQMIVVVGTAAYIGLPALIVSLVLYALRSRYGRARSVAVVAAAVAAVALSLLTSLPLGHLVANRDLAGAKAYCERIIAGLEEHKQTTGAYPPDVARWWTSGDGPPLLRHSLSYSTDGGDFELTFVDPRGLMGYVSYRSRERRWVEWD